MHDIGNTINSIILFAFNTKIKKQRRKEKSRLELSVYNTDEKFLLFFIHNSSRLFQHNEKLVCKNY